MEWYSKEAITDMLIHYGIPFKDWWDYIYGHTAPLEGFYETDVKRFFERKEIDIDKDGYKPSSSSNT